MILVASSEIEPSSPRQSAGRIAVPSVPLGPKDREIADLIAALAHVPRFGDNFTLRKDRVLVDDVEKGREAVDLVKLAARVRPGRTESRPPASRSSSSEASP